MLKRYSFLSLILIAPVVALAQAYCVPTFDNGCFNWQSMNISMGGIDWESDGTCTNFDHTATVITVGAGTTSPMVVENGVWCGVSVWVDLNSNFSFEPYELLFNEYNGNEPSRVHEFEITVPAVTPTGDYRLRVISHWGSDGVTSDNGTGPCGPYSYGNYDEFTLHVENTISIAENAVAPLIVGPNPTSGQFSVRSEIGMERVTVSSIDGRIVVDQRAANTKNAILDLSAQPAGIYQMRCESEKATQVVRVVKE